MLKHLASCVTINTNEAVGAYSIATILA